MDLEEEFFPCNSDCSHDFDDIMCPYLRPPPHEMFKHGLLVHLSYVETKTVDRNVKPPFSTTQLIALAIQYGSLGMKMEFHFFLTLDKIIAIIQSSFAYYRHDCANPDSCVNLCQQQRRRSDLRIEVTKELNLPFVPFRLLTTFEYTMDPFHPYSDNHDAIIGKTETHVFEPFLRLPIELRLMVYRWALCYEQISFHRWHWDGRETCTCVDGKEGGFEILQNGRAVPYVSENRILGLLMVSKQIRAEATPTFYLENEFMFQTVTVMKLFFQNIGPINRRYLRDIWVGYGLVPGSFTSDKSCAETAFGLLSEIPFLKKFVFVFLEELMRREYTTVTDPTKLRGLKRLRTGLRNVQLAVFDECPLIEAYLKDHITKPRIGNVKPYVPRAKSTRVSTKAGSKGNATGKGKIANTAVDENEGTSGDTPSAQAGDGIDVVSEHDDTGEGTTVAAQEDENEMSD